MLAFLFVAFLAPVAQSLHPDVEVALPGEVECKTTRGSVTDGSIAAGEYPASYFDDATKILLYLGCEDTPRRELHVGFVTPWAGWTGILLQARDAWNGDLNEVRMSWSPHDVSPQVLDGFRNGTVLSATHDSALGGSSNVTGYGVGTIPNAFVFELSIPLRSDDPFDSQLQTDGPFFLALEYGASSLDLLSEATVVSGFHTMLVTSNPEDAWTSLDLAVPYSVHAFEATPILLVVRDENGFPIPGLSIQVFVETAFGFLDLGPVGAGNQGTAQVYYRPRDAGTYVIGAAYRGGSGRLGSVAWSVLRVSPDPAGGELRTGFFGPLFDLELTPILAIVVVTLGGVWATYAYAVFVTARSLKASPGASREDAHGRPPPWGEGRRP